MALSGPDPSVDFEAWVIYTRVSQGLPPRVEDPTVLAYLAALIRASEADHQDEDRETA